MSKQHTRGAKLGRAAGLFCLGLAVLLSACSEVSEREAAQQAQGTDGKLLELGRDVAGFGGMFYDEEGTLNVHLQKSEVGVLSSADLKDAFSDYVSRPTRGGFVVQNGADLKVIDADYSFRDLLDWRAQIDGLGLDEVVLSDADERLNRVRLGVVDAKAKASLRATLAEQNIPGGAVVIDIVEPFRATKNLRDRVRPLVGGVEVEFGDYVCSLGFNATRRGQPGFVTASHCTDVQGGAERTRFKQGGQEIGVETADPRYDGRGNCPKERACRYSDSAFIDVSKNLGKDERGADAIAKTRTSNAGDRTIDGALEIVGDETVTFSGEELDKIGRTTGWSYGEVEDTCVTFNVFDREGDTGLTLLCQNVVDADVSGGDSGAPVFRYAGGGGKVYLRGVLWGGDGRSFAFSPIEMVRKELRLSN